MAESRSMVRSVSKPVNIGPKKMFPLLVCHGVFIMTADILCHTFTNIKASFIQFFGFMQNFHMMCKTSPLSAFRIKKGGPAGPPRFQSSRVSET